MNVQLRDIKGLTPAIDARKSDEPRLITGDNIRFTADGIVSDYGNEYVIESAFTAPSYAQGTRIETRDGTRCFTFIDNVIFEYDETVGDFIPIYVAEGDTMAAGRWTIGYLNRFIFFCHKSVGVIWLSTQTGEVGRLNVAGLPDVALAICVDNGRLVVIDNDAMYWSAQENGFDFSPALGEAGFQNIGARVSGRPLLCVSFARGVLTLTTGGLMRSEFTGDTQVYRHRAITTTYAPVNSLCVFKTVEDEVVFLDKRGFFSSSGEQPVPYSPLWNEFLIEELDLFRLTEKENLRVEWDETNRLLYLSVSESDVAPLYDYAYVLYAPIDKWSKFSESHYGVLPFSVSDSERRGEYYGFIDSDGYPRWWGGQSHRQLPETVTESRYIQRYVDYPVTQQREQLSRVMPCTIHVSADSEKDIATVTGYYEWDGLNVSDPIIQGLGAVARVGLLRFGPGEYVDETSEIQQITIGSILSSDGLTPAVDYNTIPDGTSNEDYLAVTGAEDFGFGSYSYVNFDLKVIACIDGRSEFNSEIPTLYDFYTAQRYYALSLVGVYFIIEFSASTAGDAFAIKTVEFSNIIDAGRVL